MQESLRREGKRRRNFEREPHAELRLRWDW